MYTKMCVALCLLYCVFVVAATAAVSTVGERANEVGTAERVDREGGNDESRV